MEEQVNSTAANLIGSNVGGKNPFNVLSKFLGDGTKGFQNIEKIAASIEKHFNNVWQIYKKMGLVDGTPGGGRLGMGSFTRTEKALGTAAILGTAMYQMAPNTSTAVAQRLAANTMVPMTGMGPNQLISRANRGLGMGATSVGAPTAAASALMYQGGMSIANQYIYNNIFKQIGGLSAMTGLGMSNEQVATALSQVNAMNFLPIGVRARDSRGNLVAPNQLINRVYNAMYGGRKITREQAILANRSDTASGRTLDQIAGGNQELRALLTAGVQFRAVTGRDITARDLRNPEKVLTRMGLPKDDPLIANLRNISAKNKLLEESQQGLVSGYSSALNANANLTEGFTKLAGAMGPVYDGLMNLKGVLQTFPQAGSVSGTLSGIGSSALGVGLGMMMSRGGLGGLNLGPAAAATYARGSGAPVMGAPAGFKGSSGTLMQRTGAFLKGGGGKFGKLIPGLGAGLSAMGGYSAQGAGQGFFSGLKSSVVSGAVGGGALAGIFTGGAGIVPGAIAGGLVSGLGYSLGYGLNAMMGGNEPIGGDNDDAVSKASMGTKGKDISLQLPVPKGTKISSHYGPREEAAARAKKQGQNISSFHRGTDFAVPVGTPIKAAADGVVTEVGHHPQYGNYVIIKHGSKSSLYAHLSKFATSRGKKVTAGELIAYSGGAKGAPGSGNSWGPHLHFELRDNGGVGAQGRINSEGLFGKAVDFAKRLASAGVGVIKSGINFVKRVSNQVAGTNFNWNSVRSGEDGWDFERSQSLEGLDTPSLSSLISSLLSSGSAISSSDLRGNSGRFKTSYRSDGKSMRASGMANNRDNKVSGDTVGMVGGNRAGLAKFLHGIGFKGKALETAFAIALAESGGRARATNSTQDYGLFQINMMGANKTDRLSREWKDSLTGKSFKLQGTRDLFDPAINTKVAYHMTQGGKDWSSWVSYNSGAFVKYLDDAARAIKKAKIPTYHTGIDRVPEEQLALLDKDEMVVPPKLAEQIRNGTSPAGGNTNINVKMDVHIARSTVQEAEYMLQYFKKELESELKTNKMGVF